MTATQRERVTQQIEALKRINAELALRARRWDERGQAHYGDELRRQVAANAAKILELEASK